MQIKIREESAAKLNPPIVMVAEPSFTAANV